MLVKGKKCLKEEGGVKEAQGHWESHETTIQQCPPDVKTDIIGDSGKNRFCGMIVKEASVRSKK